MNFSSQRPSARHAAGPALVVAMFLFMSQGVGSVSAQCSYTNLASGSPVTVSASPGFQRFTQSVQYWSAVGIRPAPGDDWSVAVYAASASFPACVSGQLEQSQMATGVDFVLGDFNPGANPMGTYYVQTTRTSGAGSAAVEWDDGPDLLFVNGAVVERGTGASDVLEVWDVFLDADVTYVFTFTATGPDMKFYIFENTGGAYWVGPSAAKKSSTGGDVSYTPQESGYHSVVATNQNGVSGSYSVAVATCSQPVALVANVGASMNAAEHYYSLNQTAAFWMGVGVRGSGNWQVEAYRSLAIGLYPTCFFDFLAVSSLAAPATDFVVGNFNNEIVGTYFIRGFVQDRLTAGGGTIEWDSGPDVIVVGDPPVNPSMNASAVLDVYDVFMETAQSYDIHFAPSHGGLKLFLMRDTGASWYARVDAELESGGSTAYASPVEGFYALVVVNTTGESGTYELGVGLGALDVTEARPTRSGVSAVMPNPTHGKLRIAYTLAERARAGFEVFDLAGRRVSRTPSEVREPGIWEAVWSGRGDDGVRAAPGVYFLRMMVNGRPVEERKIIMVR